MTPTCSSGGPWQSPHAPRFGRLSAAETPSLIQRHLQRSGLGNRSKSLCRGTRRFSRLGQPPFSFKQAVSLGSRTDEPTIESVIAFNAGILARATDPLHWTVAAVSGLSVALPDQRCAIPLLIR